jgi:hypothetical protein
MVRLALVMLFATLVGFGCPPHKVPTKEPPIVTTRWCFRTLTTLTDGQLEVSLICTQREVVCGYIQGQARRLGRYAGIKLVGQCSLGGVR